MALALPSPRTLDKGDDFMKWIDRVEIYMTAMGITKDIQRKSIVLHLLGPNMQDIYKNLLTDDDVDNYETMKRKLSNYYKPASNPVVERHIFNDMKYEAESVEEYVAQLRSQAKKCSFNPNNIDSRIRDKLVSTCPYQKINAEVRQCGAR